MTAEEIVEPLPVHSTTIQVLQVLQILQNLQDLQVLQVALESAAA
jgi:hypothetical protein